MKEEMEKKRRVIIIAVFMIILISSFAIVIIWNGERIESSQETKDDKEIEEEEEFMEEDQEEHYVFWYKYKGDEFDYAEEETFRKLKIIYDGIDFTGEFKKGNTEVYDYYKVKYAKLLNGEKKITDMDGKEYSLEYYGYSIESLLSADIYYFDMDEDGLPELCLSKNSTLIIKYMSDPD